jgi:adenylate cyclase
MANQLILLLLLGAIAGISTVMLPGISAALVTLMLGAGYFLLAQWLFGQYDLWLPLVIPLLVQLPCALLLGLFAQYLVSRRETENVSQALYYYVPVEIAERLRERADPLTPDVVFGTCLCSDIAGYTTLSERLDPKLLSTLTNEYYGLIGQPIDFHQGIRLDIVGDGMTCVWPAQYSDPAIRRHACLAALEAQQAIAVFHRRHPQYDFSTRIGLNAGWVAMGNMGGSGHYIYGIAGDIVNTASRIEGLNKFLGTRLLAEQNVVADLDDLLLRPMGCFLLKGKSAETNIVEIICRRSDASSAQVALCERFAEALSLYEKHHWNKAAEYFAALLKDYPADSPARFYLDCCHKLPIDGDTVIRLDIK